MKVKISGEGIAAGYLKREFAEELSETAAAEKKGDKTPCPLAIFCLDSEGSGNSGNCGNCDDWLRRELTALDEQSALPENLVLVSGWEVYGPSMAPLCGEEAPLRPSGAVGKGFARAEALAGEWCAARGVRLTILRPARMVGEGLGEELKALFREVLHKRFIAVRDASGLISLVTAYDVAKAVRRLYPIGGTYNLSDGKPVSWKQVAEAMSANTGEWKRMPVTPRKWVPAIRKFLRLLPAVKDSLDPSVIEKRDRVETIDSRKAAEAGVTFFNTIQMLSRTEKDFPYLDNP